MLDLKFLNDGSLQSRLWVGQPWHVVRRLRSQLHRGQLWEAWRSSLLRIAWVHRCLLDLWFPCCLAELVEEVDSGRKKIPEVTEEAKSETRSFCRSPGGRNDTRKGRWQLEVNLCSSNLDYVLLNASPPVRHKRMQTGYNINSMNTQKPDLIFLHFCEHSVLRWIVSIHPHMHATKMKLQKLIWNSASPSRRLKSLGWN